MASSPRPSLRIFSSMSFSTVMEENHPEAQDFYTKKKQDLTPGAHSGIRPAHEEKFFCLGRQIQKTLRPLLPVCETIPACAALCFYLTRAEISLNCGCSASPRS